ncbi:Uracil catabolism protein 4 [Cyberlindnera fabianii]|nr:Uracil catabolism protein 4 [Cyberlindnera fabianii]
MTIDSTDTAAAKNLLKISSVRERTAPIFNLALDNNLDYFDVDLTKVDDVVDFVSSVIDRDFAGKYDTIPPHGRWGHLNAGNVPRVEGLIEEWRNKDVDEIEIGKKLIDLFVLSVLIDAGAGNEWKYTEKGTDNVFNRSEGLAIVSIDMFKAGDLSDDSEDPHKVNASKLINFSKADLIESFQISESNPLAGTDGRLALIQNLGKALSTNETFFGKDGRPGEMIEYLHSKSSNDSIDLNLLWDTLMEGFTSIWPKGRTSINGVSLGDAWPLSTTSKVGAKNFIDTIVPFHKLTQWLCYSLLVPLKGYGYKFTVTNEALQTGLPEYRNGGLIYDFGVITLKPEFLKKGLELSKDISSTTPDIPSFKPDDGVIVEWRALTIGFLDYLLPLINKKIGYDLSLPQLIEAGSWKSGREIAAKLRPSTKGPPIDLYSDGTVF